MTTHPLLDGPNFAERDPHCFWKELEGFPSQCWAAQDLSLSRSPTPATPGEVRQIVILGMGGSAAGGDLLRAYMAGRLPIPIQISRGDGLPAGLGPETLLVAVSYSGNTEETLAAFADALPKSPMAFGVTTGGSLAALVERQGLPGIRVPSGLMPRSALGFLFFSLLKILDAKGIMPFPKEDVAEALPLVEQLAAGFGPARPTRDNEAKRLAVALEPRIPVVYGGPTTAMPAYRWKTQIEENAKRLALSGVLPELNHNEVEGWADSEARRFHIVLLRDRGEGDGLARRMVVTRDLLRRRVGDVSEVWSRGEGFLARLLSLIVLGDWVSYYLASLRGVDPWTIPAIDELKQRLRIAP